MHINNKHTWWLSRSHKLLLCTPAQNNFEAQRAQGYTNTLFHYMYYVQCLLTLVVYSLRVPTALYKRAQGYTNTLFHYMYYVQCLLTLVVYSLRVPTALYKRLLDDMWMWLRGYSNTRFLSGFTHPTNFTRPLIEPQSFKFSTS